MGTRGTNTRMKTYLIEYPRGVLVASGLTTKETAAFLGMHRSDLPPTNQSITTRGGYYVEAFDLDGGIPFNDDPEKMIDYHKLSMDDFLKSYSYLTAADYTATEREENHKYV